MLIAETQRLLLQEFTPDDADFIIELLNTPAWLQYIGDRKVKSRTDAVVYLANGPIKSYVEHGFGLYLVKLKHYGASIGMCGLIKRATLEDADIGFALLPQFEGKGYGFEAASATLSYAKTIKKKRIVAITLPENESSIKLLKKIGMHFERMVSFPGEDKELMLFAINFQ